MNIEPILYALSGFFMKLSDDAYDKKKNIFLAVFAGMFCGLFIGYLAVTSADAACIFIAILIGTILSLKVDSLNHIVALLLFVLIVVYIGIPTIGIVTLFFCSMAAFLDEIGNDNSWIKNRGRNIEMFFEYRFTLKVTILIFAVLGILQNTFPGLKVPGVQYFLLQTFVYFILFDLFYEIVGLKFIAIYNGLNSFFRVFRRIN
jgi:ABC-type amino acid transport system permease subunit